MKKLYKTLDGFFLKVTRELRHAIGIDGKDFDNKMGPEGVKYLENMYEG